MLSSIWKTLIAAAPVRLWAQIIGFGTVIAVIVHILHLFFTTIVNPVVALSVVIILAKGAVHIALALCLIALVQSIAITELKLGLNASTSGVKADIEHDDDRDDHPVKKV